MKRKWSEDEMRVLSEMYPHNRTEEVARALNRSLCSVYGKANLMGIKKSAEFTEYLLALEAERLKKDGVATRYKKGQEAWNKGVKGYIGANVTSFKKGNIPQNIREHGAERLDKDGYILVKVANRVWVLKHRLIWEQANGKIPKGGFIRFKDGNKRNFALDNIELVDMAENMRRNTMHKYPEELKSTMRALFKLKRKIKKHGKK